MVRVPLSLPRSCTAVLAAVGSLLAVPLVSAQVTELPFSEGFESGSLAPYWTVTTTNTGYAQVATSNEPFSGSYHLLMASSVDSSDSIVSADLAVDLAGHSGVILEFSMKEFNDEDDDEDGVWISDDGLSWSLVQPLTQDGGIHGYWKTWTIELDPKVLAAGMVYTDPFYIRFQWNDNYEIPTDGFAFDDIKLRVNGLTQLRLL